MDRLKLTIAILPGAEQPRLQAIQMEIYGFGNHVTIAIADRIPNFNVEPSCSATDTAIRGDMQDKDSCLKDEYNARTEIEKQWSQFHPSDRSACVGTSSGWHPIYTELLTCLEISRDVRKLHSEAPSGRAPNSPRM